jgi:hypothetical protein
MADKNQEPGDGKTATSDQELGKIKLLSDLNNMVIKATSEIENRLSDRLEAAIAAINQNIEANAAAVSQVQSQARSALETVPALIQEHIESQLKANLENIIDQVSNTFEEKVKAMAGSIGGNGGGGLNLALLLENSDKLIGIVNAFRSPTTEQAMMGQMNFVMRWHQLLSKVEKGGGSGDEITRAISDTFRGEEQ